MPTTISTINKITKGSKAKVTKLAMVPDMIQNYQDYPFSVTFLFQCFLRCLDRDNHETLSNEDPSKLARIQLMFFKLYQGLRFDQTFLNKFELDNFLRIPFCLEDRDLELPYNVLVCIDKCLKLTG